MMDYTTEELVPIVGRLAQTWTGNDHTSISYERAQQLMEAVQYCLQVVSDFTGEDNLRVSGLSAEAAYEVCLLYTSPSPRDISGSRMPSSA